MKFGQSDVFDETEFNRNGKNPSHVFESPSTSVLVSEPPRHVEFETDDWSVASGELDQPRGYFADQFEVSDDARILKCCVFNIHDLE